MERIDVQETQPWIVHEHHHRYRFVAQFARGRVLDIACGTGYAASILTSSHFVESYRGIDINAEAIAVANDRLSSLKTQKPVSYEVGDITRINAQSQSFDTVICLETLEHLEAPLPALEELKRVATHEARILVSVPDASYETLCESAYGVNEFHLGKYSLRDFQALLEKVFGHVQLYRGFYGLASILTPIDTSGGYVTVNDFPPSYLIAFCGSSKAAVSDVSPKMGVFAGLSLAAYDEALAKPLYKTISDMEAHVVELMEAFRKSEEMIEARDKNAKMYEETIDRLRRELDSTKAQLVSDSGGGNYGK